MDYAAWIDNEGQVDLSSVTARSLVESVDMGVWHLDKGDTGRDVSLSSVTAVMTARTWRCSLWACPIDADRDRSELTQCVLCHRNVNPKCLLQCITCKKASCVYCHLRSLGEKGYFCKHVARRAGAGCYFCKSPYRAHQIGCRSELNFSLWAGHPTLLQKPESPDQISELYVCHVVSLMQQLENIDDHLDRLPHQSSHRSHPCKTTDDVSSDVLEVMGSDLLGRSCVSRASADLQSAASGLVPLVTMHTTEREDSTLGRGDSLGYSERCSNPEKWYDADVLCDSDRSIAEPSSARSSPMSISEELKTAKSQYDIQTMNSGESLTCRSVVSLTCRDDNDSAIQW